MNSTILKCPNCDSSLLNNTSSFKCASNHSFDLAKEGYLNLLLPNQKKAKLPGDNKEMIINREQFLTLGKYNKLVDAIHEIINQALKIKPSLEILDLGCGSGFFLRSISQNNTVKYGLDISKYAISKASKLDKHSFYIVSSFQNIPFLDVSIDTVISNFAPLNLAEIDRVLKPSGTIIKIIPGKNHMKQMAQLIYNEFQPHTSDFTEKIENFKRLIITDTREITYDCELTNTEALNLISMTPYFHKFKLLDITLPELMIITFSFLIIEVKKE